MMVTMVRVVVNNDESVNGDGNQMKEVDEKNKDELWIGKMNKDISFSNGFKFSPLSPSFSLQYHLHHRRSSCYSSNLVTAPVVVFVAVYGGRTTKVVVATYGSENDISATTTLRSATTVLMKYATIVCSLFYQDLKGEDAIEV
ncbi:hypothetical protein QVD17_37085 [Tagetes erecta]|uniref:Uncharacterized protein n=1 Tax=Tagetes erecta TaxID=13708 RepID=A0AAD8JVD1_TARER|nr:hypothetical protein QVD17_37085 [Tagetes erecta]